MAFSRAGWAAALLFFFVSPLHAQVVGLGANSSDLASAGTRIASLQINSPGLADNSTTIYDDSLLLSRLGRLGLIASPIASTTTEATLGNYTPTSPAVSVPTVNPFFTTSLNTLTNSSPYVYPASPTANDNVLLASVPTTNVSSNWRLGSRFTSITVPSPAPLPNLGNGLGTPTANANVVLPPDGGFNGPIVGVPEPTTWGLCATFALAAGYAYFWRRWKKETLATTPQPVPVSVD